LAVLPTIVALFIIGRLVFVAPPDRTLRFFLLGFFLWLCSLLVLSVCCVLVALPFQVPAVFSFENTDYYLLWLVLFFLIPPPVFAAVAIRQFLKSRKGG
jgi:hypothetical protein